jgi:hypothetical protein
MKLFHGITSLIPDKIFPIQLIQLVKDMSHAQAVLIGLPQAVLCVIRTAADAVVIQASGASV